MGSTLGPTPRPWVKYLPIYVRFTGCARLGHLVRSQALAQVRPLYRVEISVQGGSDTGPKQAGLRLVQGWPMWNPSCEVPIIVSRGRYHPSTVDSRLPNFINFLSKRLYKGKTLKGPTQKEQAHIFWLCVGSSEISLKEWWEGQNFKLSLLQAVASFPITEFWLGYKFKRLWNID